MAPYARHDDGLSKRFLYVTLYIAANKPNLSKQWLDNIIFLFPIKGTL